MEYNKWLKKKWIISKKENGWHDLSPKTRIILDELNNAEEKSLSKDLDQNTQKEVFETFYNSPIVKYHEQVEKVFIPGKWEETHKVEEYEFKPIEKKENENDRPKLIEDENSEIFADITWEFLVVIDKLKWENKEKNKKIKKLETKLDKKDLELQKQSEEIERLKQELADRTKNSWGTTTPAHIMKKAHKTYNENK